MRWVLLAVTSALSIWPGQTAVSAIRVDARTLTVGPAAIVAELDLSVLKGSLRRLSWSSDAAYFHVQTIDRDRAVRDYIVARADGEVSLAFGEPEWAARYWAVKSDLSAPGLPALRLEVTESNRRTRPIPFIGGLNGAQTPDPKNPIDAYEVEVTVRLRGEEIGNWVNGNPMAGENFGWGPSGTGAIAFVDHRGRLTLMDGERRKTIVAKAKRAMLPAWSSDGAWLAYLQKTGRRTVALVVAELAQATP